MEKTKEEFVRFIRSATADRNSDSFIELYQFLMSCFNKADSDFDGKVSVFEFDALIEEAAALPRKYGYAPKSEDMYANESDRKAARAKQFAEINSTMDGFISSEQWISFSVNHILGKATTLNKDFLGEANVTKEEFVAFIKKAVNKQNAEFRELYFFLLKCFSDADRDRDGAVNAKEFDTMIEVAAEVPRRFGLAPSSKDMFKNEAERLAKREGYFRVMDTNQDGRISFNEWLDYAVHHIIGKIASLS